MVLEVLECTVYRLKRCDEEVFGGRVQVLGALDERCDVLHGFGVGGFGRVMRAVRPVRHGTERDAQAVPVVHHCQTHHTHSHSHSHRLMHGTAK